MAWRLRRLPLRHVATGFVSSCYSIVLLFYFPPFPSSCLTKETEEQKPEHTLTAMQRVLEEAPPIYPPMDYEMIPDIHGHLNDLARSKTSSILHIQCDADGQSISEQCRNCLNREKSKQEALSYFAFNSHDVRFNSLLPMFASLFAQVFYDQTTTQAADETVRTFAKACYWNRDGLYRGWQQLRRERAISDTFYVLGCFDECCESDALWYLSEVRRTIETSDGYRGCMRMVIVTSKNTTLSGKIADALSKFPGEVVTTIGHARSTKSPPQGEVQMSRLLLKYPEFAEPLAAAEIARLTQTCGHDQDLFSLLYRLIDNKAVAFRTEKWSLSSLEPTREQILEQLLGEIPVKSRNWARRVFAFIVTSLRPLRVFEFHTLAQLCARLEDPSYEPQWLTRDSSSTYYEAGRLLQLLQGLCSIRNDEIQLSHPSLRLWLTSEDSCHAEASPRPWYSSGSESDRHLIALDICLEHLRDLAKSDLIASLLPYAIQHWLSHYKLAPNPESDRLVTEFISDQSLLGPWLSIYASLSSQWVRPLPEFLTSLGVATYFGLDRIIKHFLDQAASSGDIQGRERAVLEAIRGGEPHMLRLLLESAPQPLEFEDRTLQKAVLEASLCGHVQVFREMVRHIPKAHDPIPEWSTLRQSRIAQNATDQSVKPTAPNTSEGIERDDHSDTPFCWLDTVLLVACDNEADDIVEMLLKLGANPESGDYLEGVSALSLACRRGSPKMVQFLLQQGADPEGRSGPKNGVPMGYAAAGGSAEVVKLLLDRGASVDAKDDDGSLPLSAACEDSCFDAAEVILQHLSAHEDLSSLKPNPLFSAVFHGSYKTAEALLRRGLNPDCHDQSRSALGFAIFSARLDLCELLLEYKADPDFAPDNSFIPPLVLAVQGGNLSITTLLMREGADVNKAWTVGPQMYHTPLTHAILNGHVDILRSLLENGANPNRGLQNNCNPMQLAASLGVMTL